MRKAMLFLAVLGMVGSLWAADSMMGTFKLNPAKSKFPAGTSTSTDTTIIVLREADADTIEAISTETKKDGSTVVSKWTTPKSGGIQTYQQGAPANGISILSAVIDPYATYNIYLQNGKQVYLLLVTMAKDGKTFTATAKGTDAQGKPNQGLWFWEKQ